MEGAGDETYLGPSMPSTSIHLLKTSPTRVLGWTLRRSKGTGAGQRTWTTNSPGESMGGISGGGDRAESSGSKSGQVSLSG